MNRVRTFGSSEYLTKDERDPMGRAGTDDARPPLENVVVDVVVCRGAAPV